MLALLLAAFVVTSLTFTAGSATGADEPQPAPEWRYDPAAIYPEVEIASRMAAEGIGRDEAIRRFQIQDAVAGLLAAQVQQRWPDTFAGLWIQTPPQAFAVRVAFTRDAAANVQALRSDFPFPSVLQAANASVSLERLRAIQDRMAADRAELQAGRSPAGMSRHIQETRGRFDLGIDVQANALSVAVDRPTAELRDAFRGRYTNRVNLVEGVAQPSACQITDCRYALLGGLEITIPSSTRNYMTICSSAFSAYYETDSSLRYLLTAGHCGEESEYDDQAWRHVYEDFGKVTRRTKSGSVDAARIKRLYSPWNESGKFIVEGETNPRPVDAYITYANTTVGTYIGKTGRTTGTTRGYIRDVDYRPSYIPNSSRIIRSSNCVNSGDSGGSVWRSNTAYGIVSGRVLYGDDGCRDIDGNVVSGYQLLYGAIDFALNDMNVKLWLGKNLAPIGSITGKSCSAPTCSFSSSSQDYDGSISARSWTFGDGGTGSGTSPSHTYSSPGLYTVTFKVTDNDGSTDSATTSVDFRLLAPTLDSATPTLGTCGVVLSWSAPSSGLGPQAYYVYRSTTSGGPYSFVKSSTTTTTTDDTVGTATTYYYVVKSGYNSWRSSNSNQRSANTGTCVPV